MFDNRHYDELVNACVDAMLAGDFEAFSAMVDELDRRDASSN